MLFVRSFGTGELLLSGQLRHEDKVYLFETWRLTQVHEQQAYLLLRSDTGSSLMRASWPPGWFMRSGISSTSSRADRSDCTRMSFAEESGKAGRYHGRLRSREINAAQCP
ncbi:MAG: hypothetical protein MZV63_01085 [Marinilabiliales bacterium]|nr:hypothetical protein [Marinilabiliales bacterium]